MTGAPEMAHQTQYTRTGKVNMINRKPYRTRAQKDTARRMAYKCDDGAIRSPAPLSFHGAPKARDA